MTIYTDMVATATIWISPYRSRPAYGRLVRQAIVACGGSIKAPKLVLVGGAR